MSRYTFTCDAGHYSGGDLAVSGGLGLTAEARNLLGSLHLLCFSLTHLSIWDWERKKEIERRRRKDSRLPSTSIFPMTPVDVSPSCPSRPPISPSFHTVAYILAGIPASCPCVSSPSLSPSFSPARRSRGRGEEGRREGRVRMREGGKGETE